MRPMITQFADCVYCILLHIAITQKKNENNLLLKKNEKLKGSMIIYHQAGIVFFSFFLQDIFSANWTFKSSNVVPIAATIKFTNPAACSPLFLFLYAFLSIVNYSRVLGVCIMYPKYGNFSLQLWVRELWVNLFNYPIACFLSSPLYSQVF